MANVKHFSDFGGQSVELVGSLWGMESAEFARRFPGVKGRRSDGYQMFVGRTAGSREPLPVTRSIEFKSHPSKHECDARCLNATGRIMKCECSCGGKNHGKGAFSCEAVS